MGVIGGGGVIHIVGLLGKQIEFPLLGAAVKDLTIKTSFYGKKVELSEVLQAVGDGHIKADEVDIRRLEDIPQALRDMADGKLKTRAVFIP